MADGARAHPTLRPDLGALLEQRLEALRSEWPAQHGGRDLDQSRRDALFGILCCKFTQSRHLRQSLLSTGAAVLALAGGPHDEPWGLGLRRGDLMAARRARELKPEHNWLGQALMLVRTRAAELEAAGNHEARVVVARKRKRDDDDDDEPAARPLEPVTVGDALQAADRIAQMMAGELALEAEPVVEPANEPAARPLEPLAASSSDDDESVSGFDLRVTVDMDTTEESVIEDAGDENDSGRAAGSGGRAAGSGGRAAGSGGRAAGSLARSARPAKRARVVASD